MHVTMLENLSIGAYTSKLLTQVTCEDISMFYGETILYLTRYAPEPILCRRHLQKYVNEVLQKKMTMYSRFRRRYRLYSLASDRLGKMRYHTRVEDGEIFYLPCFSGRGSDLANSIIIAYFLFKARKYFRALVIYNAYFYALFPALFAKWVLKKHLILDFEDDYLVADKHWGSKIAFYLTKRFVDYVIFINQHLRRYFPETPGITVNCFADFSYLTEKLHTDYREFTMIYSGSLDAIRGADLLGSLSAELSRKQIAHTIYVTGKGPLEGDIQRLAATNRQVIYKGFISDRELQNLLAAVDVGLVLQKPDHPFNQGSFPSKVDLYAAYQLPIIHLVK